MSQVNRVSNPSFETNTTGWTVTGATSGAPTRTAGSWGSGAWYGRIQASTNGVAPRVAFGESVLEIDAAPDDRVYVSVKIRADNSGAEGVRAWLRAEFWDASDSPLGFAIGPIAFLSTNGQTLYLFASTVAPPNTAKVVPSVEFEATDIAAGDQIGIDALDLRLNELPDAYFDGDGINARFTGTAHASPSERVPPVVFANPKAWKTGAVRVKGELFRCDEYGVRLDDLSRYIEHGRVIWNEDKPPGQRLSGDFRLSRRGLLRTFVDFVAPVLTLEWGDGSIERKQFGLHLVEFPTDAMFERFAQQGFRGLDPTWFPYNSAIRDTINYSSSDNVVSKMRDLLLASWPRVTFPASTRTFGVARSLYPGKRRYVAAVDQFQAMNWYVPFADLSGEIRTMPYRDMGQVTPSIRIDPEDFVGEWKVRPVTETLANVVSVYKENLASGDVPISSVAVNSDPASRISTVYRPEILRELTNADIKTQADADALTLSMLRESASYYRVISGKLSPGVWMEPHCAADVFLFHQDWGNLSGRYSVREWVVNFTQREAEVDVEMNRYVEFGSAEDQ